MNILFLMMGGSGTRLGADIPKQYIEVEGRPIFSYILEAHQKCTYIDKIVIVSNIDWLNYVHQWVRALHADKVVSVVPGGINRSTSVLNGLNAIRPWAQEEDVVLIHDATHPYCDEAGIRLVVEAIKEYGGATLGQAQFDTVYQTEEDYYIAQTLPRHLVFSGASPEGFVYKAISKVYFNASAAELETMTSAGAIAHANNISMKVIPSNVLNLKITYPNDLRLFKLLLHDFFPNAQHYENENKG